MGTATGCLLRETVLRTCGPSAGGQNKHHFFDLPLNPLALKPEWNICCQQSVLSTKSMQTNGKKPQLRGKGNVEVILSEPIIF